MDTSITLTKSALSQLSREQQRAVMKLTRSQGGLVWWKVGEGKTRIAIFWFAMLQSMYKWPMPSTCLIVCRRKSFQDWREEINRVWPEAAVYENTMPIIPPDPNPSFLLLSDAMLVQKVATLQNIPWIRCVVLDEGWLYSNHESAKSKAAKKLTLGKKRLLLSGTAIKARDLAEAYAQAMAVNKHRIVAKNLTTFRSEFQVCEALRGFPTFRPLPGAYSKFLDKLGDCADVHFPKSERTIDRQFHNIEATPQQKKLFKDLKEFYEIEADNLEYNNALVIGLKLQQISSGFYTYTREGEDQVTVEVPTNKTAKLIEECESILNSDPTATIVIWCAFLREVNTLMDKLPFATLQMTGTVPLDVEKWRAGHARVCVATEASGSAVNHFAQTPYAIYYSANFKWKDMQQSMGRTERKSSLHSTCFYKFLQVKGGIDAHVFRTALVSGEEEARFLQVASMKEWLKS